MSLPTQPRAAAAPSMQIFERRRREAREASANEDRIENAIANPEAVYALRRRQLGKGPITAAHLID